MKATYFGKVTNGLLKITNRKNFDEHLKSFEGKEVQLILDRKKKQRGTQQNRYYWGVVVKIVKSGLKETGFNEYRSDESVSDLLKFRFLKVKEVSEYGEELERVKSTTELTTIEFEEYLEEIRQWAAEFLNVQIPLPNEELELEL